VPLRIELLKYRYYDEGIFSLEPVNISTDYNKTLNDTKADTGSKRSKSDIASCQTVEALLGHGTAPIQELFSELRERILSIDETIEEKATSLYVAYRVSNNFAEIYINKSQIKIHLRPIAYDDPRGLVQKIPDGYNWTMDRRAYLTSQDDLDYVLGLIEQSYKNVL
jgi:predicted transport protein